MPQTIRVASFNTENLFSRAKVLNLPDDAVISAELEKIRELDALLRKSAYDAATKKRIIVLYGSDCIFKVDSQPGQGTTVQIELPDLPTK